MTHATLSRLHSMASHVVLLIWMGAPACLVVDAASWHLVGHTATGIAWDAFLASMVGFWSLIVPMMVALSQP